MSRYVVILITTKNKTEARTIANGLLKEKLIACANVLDGVESLFCWQGRLDKSKEVLMIIKAQQKFFKRIIAKVKLLHSYQTPEIIALPVVAGSQNYLEWINEVTE